MDEQNNKPHEFQVKDIGKLLEENFFIVPYNQRPYTWNEEKWEELWDDLKEIRKDRMQDSKDPYKIYHFLGPMFFISTKERFEIFDGQQRLVTITIMLQVLWDLLDEINMSGRYDRESVTAMSLVRPKVVVENESKKTYRIKIGSDGEKVYEWLLGTNTSPLEKISSPRARFKTEQEKQLANCYKYFLNSFAKHFLKEVINIQGSLDNPIEKAISEKEFIQYLKKMAHYILEGFYVLVSDVPDKAIGYEMFETLNQRGEKLLTIDLFKNHLFTKFQDSVGEDKINDFWKELKSILEERELGYFLRHYWISKYEFVRDKRLFTSIKRYFETEVGPDRNDFDELCETILSEVKVYSALSDPQDNLWQNKKEISESLGEINYLGFKQQLPLFLSAYKSLFENDLANFKLLLTTYLTFVVRRNLFMKKSPSEFEEEHSLWARQLRKDPSKIKNILTKLNEEIKKAYPIPEQISRGLELKDKHAKYILWKINDSITASSLMKCYKNDPTLEHVIPKNPDETWEKILEEKNMRHEEFLNRIGNLTLLSNEENSSLGNINYEAKRKKYLETQLPLNLKTFVDLDKFGKEEVKKREKILSDLIVDKKLWQ